MTLSSIIPYGVEPTPETLDKWFNTGATDASPAPADRAGAKERFLQVTKIAMGLLLVKSLKCASCLTLSGTWGGSNMLSVPADLLWETRFLWPTCSFTTPLQV